MARPALPPFFWLRLWLWARMLPVPSSLLDLQRLLVFATSDVGPESGVGVERIIHRVGRATRRPWLMRDRRCLRQGLLAFRFLRLAGYRPVLHFGVDRTSIASPRIKAHCWVDVEGKTVLNPPDETMVLIHSYDASPGGRSAAKPSLRLDVVG